MSYGSPFFLTLQAYVNVSSLPASTGLATSIATSPSFMSLLGTPVIVLPLGATFATWIGSDTAVVVTKPSLTARRTV
jgi:hypothetical protein